MNRLYFFFIVLIISFIGSCEVEDNLINISNKLEFQSIKLTNVNYKNASVSTTLLKFEKQNIIQHGHCWSTDTIPTIADNKTDLGTLISGTFNSNLLNLEHNTEYYVRAYIQFNDIVYYSDTIFSFKTIEIKVPLVSKGEIRRVSISTATINNTIISNNGGEIIEKGTCWNESGSPTINDLKTNDGINSDNFISEITGLEFGSIYYIRAYATNSIGTAYGPEIVLNMVWGVVSVKDYDGNWYNTVKIGDQVWMKENLKTTHYANGDALIDGSDIYSSIDISEDYTTKYWFNPLQTDLYKQEYGLLYNWAAIMNGSVSSDIVPSGVQGVCPDGWHVPSRSEFNNLIFYLGADNYIGGKLKETGFNHWQEPNISATNISGFTALPSGIIESDYFSNLGQYVYFWTSTEVDSDLAKIIGCTYLYAHTWHNDKYKTSGYSIRCIKD